MDSVPDSMGMLTGLLRNRQIGFSGPWYALLDDRYSVSCAS